MPNREPKLKQASAVLGVRPNDLQNFVQSGGLRPRRVSALYCFDRKALVSARVALYLKDSLGASPRYLTQSREPSRRCQASGRVRPRQYACSPQLAMSSRSPF